MESFFKSACIVISTVILFTSCLQEQQQTANTDYIDIDIGGVGFLLQPTRPTVQLPNQMVRMYPIRKDYLDDQISWFPMSTISHRQGELFGIKPINGIDSDESWNKKMNYDHDLEVKKPWYYSAWLIDDEIQVEYTPGAKSGMFRFQFQNDDFSLLFKILQSGKLSIKKDMTILEGIEEFQGMKAYVYGVSKKATKSNSSITKFEGSPKTESIAWYEYKDIGEKTISFKYGFSFISVEKAKENLEREIPAWDFDALKASGKQAWDKNINKINVKGGTDAQKRTFYTSLYRTYERMIDINEGGQYYSAYDQQVHDAERPFYADDWVWDTYLAHHPLRMILHPDQQSDMLQSYALMYQQSGWMPQFPLTFGDNPAMNGFHSTIVFLDAYRKGITNFDYELAYEGSRKMATSGTMLPWRSGPNCSLDSFYYEHGFYPALHPGEEETVDLVHSFEKTPVSRHYPGT